MPLAVSLLILALSPPPIPTTFAEVAKASGVALEIVEKPIAWTGRGYKVEVQAPDPVALAKYEKLFVAEWARYPASVFRKAKVERLVIGAKLAMNGQFRAAVPAFESGTMYYDAEMGSYRPDYQRVVIHHELFHMFDQRMGQMKRDPEWSALNPTDFKYGDGGHNVRNLGAGELTDKLPGLLTPYGGAAVEEDKAELFAHLLVSPNFVLARMGQDSVVAQKVSLLKRRMAAYDPSLDERFWRSGLTPDFARFGR